MFFLYLTLYNFHVVDKEIRDLIKDFKEYNLNFEAIICRVTLSSPFSHVMKIIKINISQNGYSKDCIEKIKEKTQFRS